MTSMRSLVRLLRLCPFLIVLAFVAAACSSGGEAAPELDGTADNLTTAEDSTSTTSQATETDVIGFEQWSMFRGDPARQAFDGQSDLTDETSDGSDEPELLWRAPTGGVVESSPAVVEGLVIAGTFDDALIAFDAASGEERWRFSVGGLVRSSPAVVDGVVYFGADDNIFYALDAQTGAELWQFSLGGGGQQSSPAVADGRVYFGAFDQNVYAIDAATGEEVWRFETGAGILSSPLVADGVVSIGSIDGTYYALDAATGGELWRFQTTGSIFSSGAQLPANGDQPDAVVFGSDDGRVRVVASSLSLIHI